MRFVIRRKIVSAVACTLSLSVSPISMAGNNIDINLSPTNAMITDDGIGNLTSNDDGANLNVGDITSAWVNNFAVTISTTTSGANTELGIINLDTALDFNGYTSSSFSLNSHNDININADIYDSDAMDDRLLLNLSPVGVVNLNSTIGAATNTTINDGLVIGEFGTYNLTSASDSLTVNSITNSAGGAFNFSAGSLTLNSTLNIDSDGLLGASFALSSEQSIQTTGMTVGTSAASSGSVMQIGGINTVDGALVMNAGGSYSLDGGSLRVGSIDTSSGGSFTFDSGRLALLNSDFTVGVGGLLGDDVLLTSAHALTNVSGDVTVDSGASLTVVGGGAGKGSLAYVSGSDGTNIGGNLNNSGTVAFGSSVSSFSSDAHISGTIFNDGADASFRLFDGTGVRPVLIVDGGVVNSNGANFTLDGGYLSTSSITNISGGSFTFNSGSLYLDQLTFGVGQLLGDDYTVDAGKTIGSPDGALNIDAGASLTLDGGRLHVDSINNSGSFTFNSGDIQWDNTVGLTVASGELFGNTLSLGNNQSLSLLNGSLIIDAGSTVNLNGGTLRIFDYSYQGSSIQNNGTFNFNSGLLELGGSGLTVGDAGLLGNSLALGSNKVLIVDQLVSIDAGASLTLNGGILRANSGINNNGSFTFNSGSLNLGGAEGLTVGAGGLLGNTVNLTANRTLSVSGGAYIESGAAVSLSGGGSSLLGGLTNNGVVNVSGGSLHTGTGDVVNNSTVKIADGATLGTSGDASHITSYGTYVQDSGKTVVNGILSSGSVVINAGQLSGSGVVNSNVTIAGGTLGPGNSPGAMEITGNLVLTEAGTLHFEVGSDGLDPAGYLYDQLIVGGDYDLQGGLLKFSLLDGIDIFDLESDFTIGDFFRTGTADSDIGFDLLQLAMFDNLDLYAYDASGDSWFSLALDETGGFLATASASPVPVPAAFWLFGSGLIGLIGVARRKKA